MGPIPEDCTGDGVLLRHPGHCGCRLWYALRPHHYGLPPSGGEYHACCRELDVAYVPRIGTG